VLHRAGGKTLWSTRWIGARAHFAERFSWWWAIRRAGSRRVTRRHRIIEQTEHSHRPRAAVGAMRFRISMQLVILYGDGPLLRQHVRHLIEQWMRADAAGALLRPTCPTHRYGRVVRGTRDEVTTIRGARTPPLPSNWQFTKPTWAFYCYRANCSGARRRNAPHNPAHEYTLTDMDADSQPRGTPREGMKMTIRAMPGDQRPGRAGGGGRLLRERKLRELMLAGVTIEKRRPVTIDAASRSHRYVVEPFARILGNTSIGENAALGAHHREFDPRRRSGDRSTGRW